MSVGASNDIYCLDADALINIQLYYPEAIRKLSRYGRVGKVVIPEGIYREICRRSDRLKNMVQTWRNKHSAVIPIKSRTLLGEVARIDTAYGRTIQVGKQQRKGFWASKSGKLAADSQVVAVAKVNGYIAVSNDQAIQDACHLENVSCIGWQEFYRRMNLGFSLQGQLF